ncbi:hypothetical protein [Burkholderia ubonensis]|uniref:hypothetical protein n=1 Tax=Burkholderia ubonensis TaxID=101571 RepID=UPI000AF30E07|nr:hypothetical protein [Burkholderia ubonensis]
MKPAPPKWRSHVVLSLLCIGFASLCARAFRAQCTRSDFYIRQGRKRYEHAIGATPPDLADTATPRGTSPSPSPPPAPAPASEAAISADERARIPGYFDSP